MPIRILRLPSNSQGRDYVIGDLHGEIVLLREKLASVGFDPAVDRLFSVGDLIDRGQDCFGALCLLDEPWFFPVQGNHETYMIDVMLHGESRELWYVNGGRWIDDFKDSDVMPYAVKAAELPHLIVVGEGAKRFHVVHAHALFTTKQIDDQKRNPSLHPETLQLTRSLHYEFRQFVRNQQLSNRLRTGDESYEYSHLPGYRPVAQHVALTFCGHTSLPFVGLWMSHFMMDGGAGYREGELAWQPQLRIVAVDDVQPIYSSFFTEKV